MSQLGIKCAIKGNMSHDACRACSLTDHPCEYPVDVLEMMRDENDIQHDRTEFTPSTLLECKRRVVLRTSNDYYVDPAQKWKMLRGEMVHALFEKRAKYPEGAAVDVIREIRLKTAVDTKYGPQVFSGKSDLIVVNRVEDGTAYIKIVDYKTTDIKHEKDGYSEKHEDTFRKQQMQLNMYAYLAMKELPRWLVGPTPYPKPVERVEIDELELAYFGWDKPRRFTSKGQLVTRGKLRSRANWDYEDLTLAPIHILPFDVTESFIVRTIEEMIEAKTELPPVLEGREAILCNFCAMQNVCFKLAGKSL